MTSLSETEFAAFRSFVMESTGISLSPAKKALVEGRLSKRLRTLGLSSYRAYLELLRRDDGGEAQTAVDLLTTNETYFWREPKHFEVLRAEVERRPAGAPFRVWSAASSTGEEAYSSAMVLAEVRGLSGWEVLGTDISTRVLAHARRGQYAETRTTQLPAELRRSYCLRGTGSASGTVLVSKELRRQVHFTQVNLDTALPDLGTFDVIFLRNVLIYFGVDTKRRVVGRVSALLRPGGVLMVSHSETLNDVTHGLRSEGSAVYRAPMRSSS